MSAINNREETYEMTIEERVEHNKIKRAVDESLLDALQAANDLKQAKSKEKGGAWVLDVLSKAVPVVVIALLSWMCVNIIEVQKDIVAMRLQVSQVESHLEEHNSSTNARRATNVTIHHVANSQRCNSCHVMFYDPRNADQARKVLKGKKTQE